jgi:hypothetical protein
MMANAANETGDEAHLGRSALTVIGRHLGTMYEDVVTGEMPDRLNDALERLRARADDSTTN